MRYKRHKKDLRTKSVFLLNSFDICFERRDDILFRSCVLYNQDREMWRNYVSCAKNIKIADKKHDLFDYVESFRKDGQRTPVHLFRFLGRVYPLGGATRLSILTYLDMPIKAIFIDDDDQRCRGFDKKWVFGKTPHFDYLTTEQKDKFIEWRKNYYECRAEYTKKNRSNPRTHEFPQVGKG